MIPEVFLNVLDLGAGLPQVGVHPGGEGLHTTRGENESFHARISASHLGKSGTMGPPEEVGGGGPAVLIARSSPPQPTLITPENNVSPLKGLSHETDMG
jgi:hypothetical protein